MKVCDSWLREWVDHRLNPTQLSERLTMLGLEVDSVETIGKPIDRLVVARVLETSRHPGADRLSLCRVDVGAAEPVQIVCGASNVRPGGLYAAALPGARLPGGIEIRPASIRGESSAGMLCSAVELGLESGAEGLLDLEPDALPGEDASMLLGLGEAVLDINVTPNRGDCLSIAGLAREIAAVVPQELRTIETLTTPAHVADSVRVDVSDPRDCPRFVTRVIRGLANASTPRRIAERLRRSGLRPIHPVVDVTNYVMLEIGQPMHAYDLAQLHGDLGVRRARAGESLRLLDGRCAVLDPDLLVITDTRGPVALAGIMGGASTAVSPDTRDIVLESAFFAPDAIVGRARRLGLQTDASMRFERGVDFSQQRRAIERATGLILDIIGGEPGSIIEFCSSGHLPARHPVLLRRERLARLLGARLDDGEVVQIFGRLGMRVASCPEGWLVTAPDGRFDISREEELIEEVARVYGYDRIPAVPTLGRVDLCRVGEEPDTMAAARLMMAARGFQEAVAYSFIAPEANLRFGGRNCHQLTLSNPISADMAVMRQSLWPGLLQGARENFNRQQRRLRLFEIGTLFDPAREDGPPVERTALGALALGSRLPEQWDAGHEPVDMFDLKADVLAVLGLAIRRESVRFEKAPHPALHPGRSARITVEGDDIGWIGELHPALAGEIGIDGAAMFEVHMDILLAGRRRIFKAFSRFPAIRRDIAVVVDREVPVQSLLDVIRHAAGSTLQEAFVFDIYTGPQIGDTEKSVAIGLILQDTSRTLTDADAEGILAGTRSALAMSCTARFRE